MKLSELAKCIKECELIKWKIRIGKIASKQPGHLPIQYYYINEFPLCSAFCDIFREWKYPNSDKCYCPVGRTEKTCVMNPKTKKHFDEAEMLHHIESIPIETIMKMIKKTDVLQDKDKMKKYMRLWKFHIEKETDEYKNYPNSTQMSYDEYKAKRDGN